MRLLINNPNILDGVTTLIETEAPQHTLTSRCRQRPLALPI